MEDASLCQLYKNEVNIIGSSALDVECWTLLIKAEAMNETTAILGEQEVFIFLDRRSMDSHFHGNDARLLISHSRENGNPEQVGYYEKPILESIISKYFQRFTASP